MPHRYSLFSQRLDRVCYVAYFLGAVIPLGALAAVVRSSDALTASLGNELMPFIVAAGVLSLACFLLLRRMTRRALERMDEDSRRLSTLLNASTALTSAQDPTEAAKVAATYAARLTNARAAFVVAKGAAGRLQWIAGAGADADELRSARAETFERLACTVVEEGRPAMRSNVPGRGSDGSGVWLAPTTVAVPFVTGSGMAIAALIVVHGTEEGRFEAQHLDALLTLAGLASVSLANAELRRALAEERYAGAGARNSERAAAAEARLPVGVSG